MLDCCLHLYKHRRTAFLTLGLNAHDPARCACTSVAGRAPSPTRSGLLNGTVESPCGDSAPRQEHPGDRERDAPEEEQQEPGQVAHAGGHSGRRKRVAGTDRRLSPAALAAEHRPLSIPKRVLHRRDHLGGGVLRVPGADELQPQRERRRPVDQLQRVGSLGRSRGGPGSAWRANASRRRRGTSLARSDAGRRACGTSGVWLSRRRVRPWRGRPPSTGSQSSTGTPCPRRPSPRPPPGGARRWPRRSDPSPRSATTVLRWGGRLRPHLRSPQRGLGACWQWFSVYHSVATWPNLTGHLFLVLSALLPCGSAALHNSPRIGSQVLQSLRVAS